LIFNCIGKYDNLSIRIKVVTSVLIDIKGRDFNQLESEISERMRGQSCKFSDKDRKVVEDTLLRNVRKLLMNEGVKWR
jgi:hypothetical protein